ncbi:hypothetical protein ASF06_03050 [Agreia sp. Leaf244]|uniref:hypothetical protein n=1 Tax=Agreia sp. Leaf244 TaxID=1736305 RepID=UPI0006F66201|nr:hypothetical protein [Agreia sp. Leaf244]KQO11627.1 hypothetical protein ASF06_03050 [Agreia sp. Leaf244]
MTTHPSHAQPISRRPKALPILTIQIILSALVASAFVGIYLGLQRDPAPISVPLVTTSQELATSAESAWGEKASVTVVDTVADAEDLLRTDAAVAAFVPTASGLDVYTAGANGRSVTMAATGLIEGLAEAADLPVASTTDVVPLAQYDRQGLSSFYLVFGVTLAAFILAQILSAMSFLSLRSRILAVAAGAIVSAVVAGVLAGPVLGAVPATLWVVIPGLALLSAAVSVSTMAIAAAIGPIGNVLSTLLFTVAGNATGGATVSPFLMPPLVATLGALLPQGAAFRLIVNTGYFGGANTVGPVVVLLAWNAAAALLLFVASRRAARRNAAAASSAVAAPAVAAPAVAAAPVS